MLLANALLGVTATAQCGAEGTAASCVDLARLQAIAAADLVIQPPPVPAHGAANDAKRLKLSAGPEREGPKAARGIFRAAKPPEAAMPLLEQCELSRHARAAAAAAAAARRVGARGGRVRVRASPVAGP